MSPRASSPNARRPWLTRLRYSHSHRTGQPQAARSAGPSGFPSASRCRLARRSPSRRARCLHVSSLSTALVPPLTLLLISQTPTLNAAPIVRGVIEACAHGGKDKQGIQVTMILGLGFNDKGESVPFQGGTNEVRISASRRETIAHSHRRRAGGRLPLVQEAAQDEERAEPSRLLVHR